MNVFILTDLEGIAGVNDIEYMDRSTEKYSRARELLSRSINLATEAAISAGADKVYYLDGHGGGGNVIDAMIDRRAVKCTLAEWQQLLRSGEIDCQIELGSHARAGTVGGFLDHTVSSKSWFSHRVNGREMSELSMHALLCGAYGVPIAACIGDETACRQAREYIPEIVTGTVKRANCRNFSVDFENTDAILVDAVKTAVKTYKSITAFKMPEPLTVELTFYRTDMCETALKNAGDDVVRTDARTLARTVERITKYEDLKF